MSDDPFEKLFGEIADQPEPVSARERLSYEQAERLSTAQLPVAERKKTPRTGLKPWVVVGAVAAFALVVSGVLVSVLRPAAEKGSDEATPSVSAPTQTNRAPEEQADSPQEDTQEESEGADSPPTVDVGTTGTMDIPTWNVSAQISGKFQWPQYELRGESLVLLNSSLINQLPDSCAAMREQWGITRVSESTFEVLKPDARCEEAPELYDELWGLTAAMVESITPL